MFRIGLGHDTHRPGAGDVLRLGGITIPHDKTAIGHSDADVLLHAITDALLGAAALGDIGEMFPGSDPANEGRDSADMLRAAHAREITKDLMSIGEIDGSWIDWHIAGKAYGAAMGVLCLRNCERLEK